MADDPYRSRAQRLSRWLHRLKARYRAKARPQVRCLAPFIPPGGAIIDVGAHFGYFAKEFCALHDGSCEVHCFEPLSYNHAILCEVLRARTNATVHKTALSDRNGTDRIYVPIKRSGKIGPGLAHMGMDASGAHVDEPITTVTLDDWLREAPLQRVDFIKCDVEGAELRVVDGAERTLRTHRPVLLLEIDDHYTRRLGYQPVALFERLAGLGYEALELTRALDLEPVSAYRGGGDYLFRPARTAAEPSGHTP